jgi:GNAT superfamily N-acetyltransferase
MIRLMTQSDVPAGMELKQAAGWNQTEADWRLLLAVAPRACWVEELDGRVVGSATAVCYGDELAWIGMVLVLPEYRRRGVGRRLLEHAIGSCDAVGIRRLALDATEMGRPLYRSLGFVDQEPIERWGGVAAEVSEAAPTEEALTPACLELDRQGFGVDRRDLVQRLAGLPGAEVVADGDSFAITRPGANARYLGPLVARDLAAAQRVGRAAAARHRGERLFFDILPERPGFSELAESLGLQPMRRLTRMSRPAAIPDAGTGLFCSAAGFELG